MKCRILFTGKNKENIINLSSAENAQRVVKAKCLKRAVFANFLFCIQRVPVYINSDHGNFWIYI